MLIHFVMLEASLISNVLQFFLEINPSAKLNNTEFKKILEIIVLPIVLKNSNFTAQFKINETQHSSICHRSFAHCFWCFSQGL